MVPKDEEEDEETREPRKGRGSFDGVFLPLRCFSRTIAQCLASVSVSFHFIYLVFLGEFEERGEPKVF